MKIQVATYTSSKAWKGDPAITRAASHGPPGTSIQGPRGVGICLQYRRAHGATAASLLVSELTLLDHSIPAIAPNIPSSQT
jgi:hypothetical protein